MNKQTRFFQTIGLTLAMAHQSPAAQVNAAAASAAGTKYLRDEKNPTPVWTEISTARDLFTQYEPPTTKRLTASLHDVALHRYIMQRTR